MFNLSINVVKDLIKCYTSRQINVIAKRIGFLKRQKVESLRPETFLKAFTIGIWEKGVTTLDEIAVICEKYQRGLKITKQALHQRLKVGAALMKEFWQISLLHVLKRAVSDDTIETLNQFKNVLLFDGTIISLPEKLKETWQGFGGSNSKAGIKIYCTYNILTKEFQGLDITNAKDNDRKYAENIAKTLQSGDLGLFDLGFFKKEVFKAIMDKKAYFISRIKNNTLFYSKSKEEKINYDRIDIADILRNCSDIFDEWLYIGGQHKRNRIKVRIVGIKLPDQIINERIRKANKKAKEKGKTLSSRDKELLKWHLAITNIPESMLTVKNICDIYRSRWQIELVFKCLKGNLGIDKVGNVGKEYLECMIYGRLMVFTLIAQSFSSLYYSMYRIYQRGMSIQKFTKLIGTIKEEIINCILYKGPFFTNLVDIIDHIAKKSLFDKRKRKTTDQILREYHLPVVNYQNIV